MRHISLLPLAVAPLSFGVAPGSMQRALVTCAGAVHSLPASELSALARAVDVAAITLRADADLHPAALAMVEPVGHRLLEQPQAPPSATALDSAGAARHKGSAKPPPKALGTEGPGVRRQSNDPGLRLICSSQHSGSR